MEIRISRKYIELFAHLGFWVGLMIMINSSNASYLTIEEIGVPKKEIYQRHLDWIIFLAGGVIFYINILSLSKHFFLRKKYVKYILLLLISVSIITTIEYFIFFTYFHQLFELYLNKVLSVNLMFFLFSMVYVFTNYFVLLDIEIKKKEHNKIVNELMFLKAQLSPHFLFNTINNIFSTAQTNKDFETAQQLSDFTKVIRYSLYESNESLVNLEKELRFLKSYVKMSMLKFKPEDIDFNFNIEGEVSGKKIAPLILVSLIENAFKHGLTLCKPCLLNIYIQVTDKDFFINVKNSYNPTRINNELNVGGIGLKNLKRRLDLLYPDKYDITILKESYEFDVKLKLIINA